MPILTNNIQERIERSIYEAMRLVLVADGWTPDVTLAAYTTGTPTQNQANWKAALAAIAAAKGFAVEVFGHSSSENKGQRKTPRVSILPRRILPGDVGNPPMGGYSASILDPLKVVKIKTGFQSAHIGLDIVLTTSSAKQNRLLEQLIGYVFGQMNFIPFYDNPLNVFFIRQYNYQDVPDNIEGEEEKIYSYECPDIFLSETIETATVPINEITVDLPTQNESFIVD